ncbi:3-oxo-5-alpha-steroid 4-dehydrogenase family protein [Perilla frutescens var. hirtella]|uniref:Steroid 5-alpha-reductase DET2 n=1 Tax=Perilla frutescens var. hirtella TaxID=608512 RepID=A0AAD4JAI4_PERFH|nr:3-oxo-5-alpha-steroid 4-dehydrogenase family protein [Perilla frutescens var. hirtella]
MFSDDKLFDYILLSLFLITPPTILSSLFLTAPYGKHHRAGWGATLPPPVAWCLMESPTIWLTLLLFPHGRNSRNPRAIILITPFLLHYLHRTLIYPLRLFLRAPRREIKNSGFPAIVAAMAFGFNTLNAYLQARWVSEYADLDSDGWFWWRMVAGTVVFGGGAAVNIWSDNLLMGLKEAGGGYRIPRGGLFEWICCPNYFGEILEWSGWALMTWSWAGLGFLVYTCAYLVPRARANRKWYMEKFGEDFPNNRKAIIPFMY